jgi:hypothetical protein
MAEHEHDERLLAELADAVRRRDPVPVGVLAAARGSFAWRTIDAELAALELDSSLEVPAAGVRAGSTDVRTLVFTAADISVELGVTADRIDGQLVPPTPAEVEVRTPDGVVETVQADELGCFTIHARTGSLLSLQCRTADGDTVVTEWIRL